MNAIKCQCGAWFNERAENPHGACKVCRHKATQPKRKRRAHRSDRMNWEAFDAFESGRPMSSDDY